MFTRRNARTKRSLPGTVSLTLSVFVTGIVILKSSGSVLSTVSATLEVKEELEDRISYTHDKLTAIIMPPNSHFRPSLPDDIGLPEPPLPIHNHVLIR